MTGLAAALERGWLWVYTAGMPPPEADDRRAEIRSDQWEYAQYASAVGAPIRGDRLRRLVLGMGDDLAWRASFGLRGLSAARQHEFVLLVCIAGFFAFAVPAAVWWCIALAGDFGQPGLQISYIATQSIALALTVIGGAVSAACYPRAGRTLLLAGSVVLVSTLWWTPIVAAMLLVSAIALVLALPARARPSM